MLREYFVGFITDDHCAMWCVETDSPLKAVRQIAKLNGLDASELEAW